MLESFRIGTRLAVGFGGLMAAAALSLGAAVVIGQNAQTATSDAARDARDRLETVYAMERSQLQLVSAVRNAGLQTDSARINEDMAAYQAALKALKAAEATLGAMALDDEERRLLESAVGLRKQAEPLVDEASRYTMALDGEEAAKVLAGPFAALQARWAADLARLGERTRANGDAANLAIAAANRRHWVWLGGAMAAVALVALAFAVALTRSVTRPLQRATEVAQRVAGGDLSVHIDARGRDEAAQLLQSLQTMAQQLSQMVRAVRECSESIDTASREISSGNLDLSSRTETQAASLQQAAATLTDLSQAVAQYSSHAERVRQLTEQSAAIADESGSTMQRMAATMNDISDSSRRIGEIIGVIDGIAFQTNILALNAAVEAARAGEQGRGFAVVASEVRALAQRVSQAAGEVRGLIGESVTRVEGGTRLVSGMGDTLQGLLGSVSGVRDLVGEISAASHAQSERLREVDGSVRAIDGATQQNAALVEQVASAAQSLSGQTGRLSDLVRRFRLENPA